MSVQNLETDGNAKPRDTAKRSFQPSNAYQVQRTGVQLSGKLVPHGFPIFKDPPASSLYRFGITIASNIYCFLASDHRYFRVVGREVLYLLYKIYKSQLFSFYYSSQSFSTARSYLTRIYWCHYFAATELQKLPYSNAPDLTLNHYDTRK